MSPSKPVHEWNGNLVHLVIPYSLCLYFYKLWCFYILLVKHLISSNINTFDFKVVLKYAILETKRKRKKEGRRESGEKRGNDDDYILRVVRIYYIESDKN